jgi:hypothetical protein
MKQKAEITFETEETIVFREGSCIRSIFCPACGERVLMASPQAIAAISNLTEREIFRLLEYDRIHFSETDRVLICMKSVAALQRSLTRDADRKLGTGGTLHE